MRFALKNNIKSDAIEKFLVQVDKLKSSGNLSDSQIIFKAFEKYCALNHIGFNNRKSMIS